MTNVERGIENVSDPLQFAFNAGVLVTDITNPSEQVVEDMQGLLTNMGCRMDGAISERFGAIVQYTNEDPINRDSPVFDSLIETTVGALLWRSNEDVQLGEVSENQEDLSAQTTALLESFMDGISSSNFSRGYIKQLVGLEIKSQQRQLDGKTSYSAIGAAKYLDRISDNLEITNFSAKARRVIRSIRAIRVFGDDIYSY